MTVFLYGGLSLIAAFIAAGVFVFLAPECAVHSVLWITRRSSGLVRRELRLSAGVHLVYLTGGEGTPLMLLHGFGGNKDTFTRVARYLTPHYRLIIPDIIGFGESSQTHGLDYALPAQVDRLRTLANALGVTTLHLGGNSMGGQLALLYAARYPSEVGSLWLLSPAGIWSAPRTEAMQRFVETGHNPLIARTVDEYRAILSLGLSRPPYIPRPMLKVLARDRIRNVALEETIFRHLIDQSLETSIKGLQTPSLIAFGDQDSIISIETATVLHRLLSNSQVTYITGAGHVAMLDKPAACAEGYLSFRWSTANRTSRPAKTSTE